MSIPSDETAGPERGADRRARVHNTAVIGALGVALLMLAAMIALLPGRARAQDTIRPGYWESRNTVSFPVAENSASRQCITAQKVAQFLSGPQTRHYRCTYSRSDIRDGKVSAAGSCVDKNGLQSTIDVDGGYTPDSFQLTARLVVSLAGLPIPITATTQAQRVSDDCPADLKP